MDNPFQHPIQNLFMDTPTPQEDSMNINQTDNIQNNQNIFEQNLAEKDFYDEMITLQEEEDIFELQVPIQQNQNYLQLNQDVDMDAKVGAELERIELSIIPRQETVGLKQQTQLLPVIVQVQVLKSQIQHVKPIVDLVCVVDVSSSMEGDKILQVKESLRYIEKILSPLDRISIITFDTQSRINLPWTRNTPNNKEKIENAIIAIKVGGDSTNIADGVNLGLSMIKYRRQKNPVTCMFVLTGGNDKNKCADERVAQFLTKCDIKDSFSINSFVYGSDYDAKVMKNIANLKQGIFEYIENVPKGSQHFNFAMRSILPVLSNNVTLQVLECPGYKISKIYQDELLWKEVQQGKYETEIQYLLDKDNKLCVLLLELPANEKINLQQDVVLKVSLSGTLTDSNRDFSKQCELKLNFSLQEILYEPIEFLEVNLLIAKARDAISEAVELVKQNYSDLAQFLLNELINEILESKFNQAKQLASILQDLEQVKDIYEPKLFIEKGEMLKLDTVKPYFQRQQSSDSWQSDTDQLELSVCYSSHKLQRYKYRSYLYQKEIITNQIDINDYYSSDTNSPIQQHQSSRNNSIHKNESNNSL